MKNTKHQSAIFWPEIRQTEIVEFNDGTIGIIQPGDIDDAHDHCIELCPRRAFEVAAALREMALRMLGQQGQPEDSNAEED